MSATPVEQRAERVEQWAQLNGSFLEWLVDDEDVCAVFEDALWCACDLLALLARLEAAEGEGARLRRALADLLEWAERYRGGEPVLDPEEWYAVRDFARKLLAQSEGLPS